MEYMHRLLLPHLQGIQITALESEQRKRFQKMTTVHRGYSSIEVTSVLQLRQVQDMDSGLVQCVAMSGAHMMVTSGAHLVVLGESFSNLK